jgi:hypothetical protein
MKIPKLQKPEKYVGLYIFDFGDQVSVGFTAEEIAELLESEKYKDGKVYKIYRAYPDGRLELRGVPADTFQLEAGMFFYSDDIETAKDDYNAMVKLAVETSPPCLAKVQLSEYNDNHFVVAIIYPAEYDGEISQWLITSRYKTTGSAEGGVGAVQRYYEQQPKILERQQLFNQSDSRTGQELLENIKVAIQR